MTETFGSKLLNTVMEAMFSEEMTELEAWVARMERLYPPEMERPKSSIPAAWQQWAAAQPPTLAAQVQAVYAYNRQTPIGLPSAPQRDLYSRVNQYNGCLNTDALTGAGIGILGGLFGGLF